jgi:hypothetical protein
MTLHLEVLLDLLPRHLDNRNVLDSRRHLHLLRKLPMHGVFQELPEDSPQRLARPRFGNHAFPLDDAAERSDAADLGPHQTLYLVEELLFRHGGHRVVRHRERDEGERELALQGVGDADDASFGDLRVAGDGLLDASCA